MSSNSNDEWPPPGPGVAYRGAPRRDDGYDVSNVEVVRETGRAICVRGAGLSSDPFNLGLEDESWVPLSQLHDRSEVRHVGDKGLLVISTWLAKQRGLVDQ